MNNNLTFGKKCSNSKRILQYDTYWSVWPFLGAVLSQFSLFQFDKDLPIEFSSWIGQCICKLSTQGLCTGRILYCNKFGVFHNGPTSNG